MKEAIATIKKTRSIQEKYGVQTKKAFGQNFIIEPKVVEKIANAAIASKNDLVIEVGRDRSAHSISLRKKRSCDRVRDRRKTASYLI